MTTRMNLSSFGGGWIDLKYDKKYGFWIEEVQYTFSRVSVFYATMDKARKAFDTDTIEWAQED